MLETLNQEIKPRILKEVHYATQKLKQSNFEIDAIKGPNET